MQQPKNESAVVKYVSAVYKKRRLKIDCLLFAFLRIHVFSNDLQGARMGYKIKPWFKAFILSPLSAPIYIIINFLNW